MEDHGASLLSPLAPLGLGLLLACSLPGLGCLPAYDPGPTGGSQQVTGDLGPSGDPGTPGTPGQNPTPEDMGAIGSGATADLAMGSTGQADLGSTGAVLCDKVQSTAALSSPSGHHNAGKECQGCHAPGNGAPTFYLGGTLYSAVSGGTAVAGATINVTDAAGTTIKIISADNGNFWSSTPLVYPLKVNASLCPSTVAMSSTVGGNGACNNCHNSTFRVHVP